MTFSSWFEKLDQLVIFRAKRLSPAALRFSLCVLFFWFGALKVLGVSPAGPLVEALAGQMIPGILPATFNAYFGILEGIIGLLFLIPTPRVTRVVIGLLFFHMGTTFLPLILLPQMTWIAPFVPTMEGQYILKNLVILASAITIISQTEPLEKMKK